MARAVTAATLPLAERGQIDGPFEVSPLPLGAGRYITSAPLAIFDPASATHVAARPRARPRGPALRRESYCPYGDRHEPGARAGPCLGRYLSFGPTDRRRCNTAPAPLGGPSGRGGRPRVARAAVKSARARRVGRIGVMATTSTFDCRLARLSVRSAVIEVIALAPCPPAVERPPRRRACDGPDRAAHAPAARGPGRRRRPGLHTLCVRGPRPGARLRARGPARGQRARHRPPGGAPAPRGGAAGAFRSRILASAHHRTTGKVARRGAALGRPRRRRGGGDLAEC